MKAVHCVNLFGTIQSIPGQKNATSYRYGNPVIANNGVQHANPGMHACARAQYANSEYNSMGKTRNSKTVG